LLEVANQESPCLVPDTLYQVNEETKAEKCSEESIGADRRVISIECTFYCAWFRANFNAVLWGGSWDGHRD
jgi:hypothetical protein